MAVLRQDCIHIAWQDSILQNQVACYSVLQQYCINTARQDAGLAILHQHCIHTVCQGQDYVRMVNVDAVLRQGNHVAWVCSVDRNLFHYPTINSKKIISN